MECDPLLVVTEIVLPRHCLISRNSSKSRTHTADTAGNEILCIVTLPVSGIHYYPYIKDGFSTLVAVTARSLPFSVVVFLL